MADLDFSKLPDKDDSKKSSTKIDFNKLPDNGDDDKSMFGRMWDKANTPLVPVGNEGIMPQARSAFREQHPIAGAVGDFAIDTLSSLTSPLSLALSALGGGSQLARVAGLGKTATALEVPGRVAAGGMLLHGGRNALDSDLPAASRVGGGIEALLGGLGVASPLHETANVARQADRPISFEKPISLKEPIKSLDPNLNNGMGDPMLAGSEGYRHTTGEWNKRAAQPQMGWNEASANVDKAVKSADPVAIRGDIRKKTKLLGSERERNSIQNDLDDYTFDEKTGNYIPNENFAPNNPKNLQPKTLQQSNQIAKLATPEQKKSLWAETRDANRAILTAHDLSAPGRQGKPLMLTKAYWTSFDDMFKSWGSENAYKSVMDSIDSHPNFKKPMLENGKPGPSIAERAGLDVGGKSEQFNSKIAEAIPGVRRSERAYNAFLDKLRSDHFNTLLDDYKKSGVDIANDDVKLKAIGSFINDATGRGDLGRLQKSAPVLNELFFAPKLMASRVNMYKRWLNPMTYADSDPIMRKQALKSLLATVGFGTAVGELAKLGGAEVSNNPDSSDYKKIKIGDTRIDPFSGFQQYAVAAHRLMSGQYTSSNSGKTSDLNSGKFGMPTRGSVVANFAKNKLAPVPSLVWSFLDNKEFDGTPFEAKKAIASRTIPIVMQDLYDLGKEDPKLLGFAPLPLMGEGIQTYGR